MTETLESKLRAYSLILQRLPGADNSSLPALYLRLADLRSARPLELGPEFALPVPESLPAPLRELLTEANSAFQIRSPSEMQATLGSLIRLARKPRHEKDDLAKILKAVAEKWLAKLEQQRSSLYLAIYAPHDRRESEIKVEDGGFLSEISIAAENSGLLLAYDVNLYISGSGFKILDAQKLPTGSWKVMITSEIPPGSSRGVTLRVRHRTHTTLRLIAEYSQARSGLAECKSDDLPVDLAVPLSGDRVDTTNPFLPDLPLPPLTPQGDWNRLMRGERERIVSEILEDPLMDQGRVYVIRGVRRSGKTSLLLGLDARMRGDVRFLPSYIDIFSWHINLTRQNTTVDAEGLLYELADSAVRSTRRLGEEPDVAKVEEALDKHQEGMTLNAEEFGSLMNLLQETTGRRIVFILDELDWWINREPFKDAQNILSKLAGFALKGRCAIILAHDWTAGGWEAKYHEDRLLPMILHLGFLQRDAFDSLVLQMPLPFTAPAIEHLWRLTGGWPGLVQLICYELTKIVVDQSCEAKIVDLKLIEKGVESILMSSDRRPFLARLLESFSRAECEFLRWLARSERVGPQVATIRGLHFYSDRGYSLDPDYSLSPSDASLPIGSAEELGQILLSLTQKQIIERRDREGDFFLRVGILVLEPFISLKDMSEAAG